MNVEHEVSLLVREIKRLGSPGADGKHEVTFGVLFNDTECANIFEALVGTLRAAKRKKIVNYDDEKEKNSSQTTGKVSSLFQCLLIVLSTSLSLLSGNWESQ